MNKFKKTQKLIKNYKLLVLIYESQRAGWGGKWRAMCCYYLIWANMRDLSYGGCFRIIKAFIFRECSMTELSV